MSRVPFPSSIKTIVFSPSKRNDATHFEKEFIPLFKIKEFERMQTVP